MQVANNISAYLKLKLPLTWLNAVDNAQERISVPPALSEVVDLDPELLRDLSLAPLEQRLPRSDLPLLLDGDPAGLVSRSSGS